MKYAFKNLKFLLVSVLLTTAACNYGDTVVVSSDTSLTPLPPSDTVVCDPFNTQNPALQGHGLVAKLSYLSDDQPRYTNVMDAINNGHQINATVYMNDVNVPTRPFDRGFFTQAGSLIVNNNGNALYEYFSVDMQSTITLGPIDPEGDYQFAVLADDGAILEIQDPVNGYQNLVNDDGTHPTMLGCETPPIRMIASTQLPIKFHYFQGPRYHIALMLLWRPYPTGGQTTDPLCGQAGNSLFFDSTQTPPAPMQAYNDLTSRGWKPLTSINYLLPATTGANNPCATSSAALISNFGVASVTRTTAVITWDTDLPSSTQLAYELAPASSYTFTTTDAALTTSHTVTLTGLQNFGFYTVYGLSTSKGLQTVSNTINFRTLR
jgi:hypothetical protein